jgi:hypothetical protein
MKSFSSTRSARTRSGALRVLESLSFKKAAFSFLGMLKVWVMPQEKWGKNS